MTLPPVLPSWFTLAAHDSLSSTNDEAKRIAAADPGSEGTVVWARTQNAGRGRQNRQWVSEAGNLYCSLILRPDCPARDAAGIGFVAPLAALEALTGLSEGLDPSLKWPNDILVGGEKIGGILLESSIRGERVEWLVVGLGLNLASHPDGTEFPATSLKSASGAEVEPEAALAAFCACFEAWYRRWRNEGFAPVRAAWLEKSHAPGDQLRVRRPDGERTGNFHGLDEDGALLLERDGNIERIDAGDVFFAGQI
ncbi:MAG: biotin--[acetyl-CoA-carboxylase] ligase [Rhodospirillales bacterium]|nr:biotin--[acetyl-CoA-carboxylase] ligase [Rhodospirillaceae bacterium]MDP6427587.1 biotin--[acetyl-CoA-carboxylase] ligase [Rhodospirillales bacterium]MDP6643497.1 biotin--[acetyl-CoA-carboxylase] ligase [Rhodospirillales bacterium]